ncbi:ZIP family metal transporter [Mycobacterium riyadhense]
MRDGFIQLTQKNVADADHPDNDQARSEIFHRTAEFAISILTTVTTLVTFPVLASIIGAVAAVVRTPSAAVVSGIQHFAAGVVMAAVAGEVLPELRAKAPLGLIILGFSVGVALLVLMRQFAGDKESAEDAPPVGFLAVVSVDLFIDGLLVATGAAASRRTAVIITIALTVEVLFLGVSVALRLAGSGVPKVRAALTTSGVSLMIAVGGVLGALLLHGAGNSVLSLVLAFAAAALLWLVVEELLVEAHETPERPWMAVMFFSGFLTLYCLGVLE